MSHTYTWRGDTVEVPGLGLNLMRDQEFTTTEPFNHPDAEEVVPKKTTPKETK